MRREYDLDSLMLFCTTESRICPQWGAWARLWDLLKVGARERRTTGYDIAMSVEDDTTSHRLRYEPPRPNILSSWWATSDVQKIETLRKQLIWAAQHDLLDVADDFLRGLGADQWHYNPVPDDWSAFQAMEEEWRAKVIADQAQQAENRDLRLHKAQSHRDRKPAIDRRYQGILDQGLIRAYRATNYMVFADPPFALRIGEHSAMLARILEERAVSCAAYITAWNPKGVAAAQVTNEAAQQRLRVEVEELGFECLSGEGRGEIGDWPPEASFLILGCSRSRAKKLGHQFKQNAVVWIGPNAVPELIMLMPFNKDRI